MICTTYLKFFIKLLITVKLSNAETSYTKEDIEIIRSLGKMLSANYFVILSNERNDKMVETSKEFFNSKLFFSVVTMSELNEILKSERKQWNFFQMNVLMASKGDVNFTGIVKQVLFPHSLKWILFSDSIEEIRQHYIPLNMKLFVINSSSSEIVARRVFNIKNGEKTKVKQYANWPKGETIGSAVLDKNFKIDFENATMNVILHKSDEKACKSPTGLLFTKIRCFHSDIVYMVAQSLKFHVNVVKLVDLEETYSFENGSYSEMILALRRGDVDLSGGAYVVSEERLKIYDFVWPTFKTRSMLYIKSTSGERFWQSYLKPFHLRIHYVIIACIVLYGIIIEISKKLRCSRFRLPITSLLDSVLTSFRAFCSQDLDDISHWLSDRIACATIFLLVLILHECYAAKLIASITVHTPYIPFLDLEGLYEDDTYVLMSLNSGFHQLVFSNYLQYKGTSKALPIEQRPENPEVALDRLCHEKNLAYFEFRENVVGHLTSCKIIEIPRSVFSHNLGLGLPNNSSHKEYIMRELTSLQGYGLLNRMKRNILSYEKLKSKKAGPISSVHLEQVSFIFFILSVGICASFGVFLLEVTWSLSSRNKFGSENSRLKINEEKGKRVKPFLP